jgi:hypothetical protein
LHRRNATMGMIVTWIRFSIWHGDDAGWIWGRKTERPKDESETQRGGTRGIKTGMKYSRRILPRRMLTKKDKDQDCKGRG